MIPIRAKFPFHPELNHQSGKRSTPLHPSYVTAPPVGKQCILRFPLCPFNSPINPIQFQNKVGRNFQSEISSLHTQDFLLPLEIINQRAGAGMYVRDIHITSWLNSFSAFMFSSLHRNTSYYSSSREQRNASHCLQGFKGISHIA